ncbi:unnamed protein product [Somion occarium]|uniref:Uncharacterized protein n=1 Tax=Somion occarium TaxID=3059160 RepID=A0ABP1E0A8_9APHY
MAGFGASIFGVVSTELDGCDVSGREETGFKKSSAVDTAEAGAATGVFDEEDSGSTIVMGTLLRAG